MVIVSLASYDKRYSYLRQTIGSILKQTLRFDRLVINIPDDSEASVVGDFEALAGLDDRISVKTREARWRSANKLLWTAAEHPDDVVITCDDDIFYPDYFFKALYDRWQLDKDCVVAQEISPVFLDGGRIQHISCVDVKLMQKTFGRYLTGCCLFPPRALEGTCAYDWEKFSYVTNATHDELWFWCMTTMKGIRSIGLNCTYSFDSDETVLPRDENSLSRINSDPYLAGYNARINETFGRELYGVLKDQVCEFPLTKDNLLAVCGFMQAIYGTYGKYYRLRFVCDGTVLKSHLKFFAKYVNEVKWNNKVEVKLP